MGRADRLGRVLGLLGAALLAFGAGAGAQEGDRSGPKAGDREVTEGRFERLKHRWHDRPEAERRQLEERWQRFRDLPEESRLEVLGRAQVLREREHEMRKSIPPGLKTELDALSPAQRRERWHEHVLERFETRGHALRDRMPPEVRERLEKAPPGARRRMAERLFRDRERHLRELGISPEECRQWQRLPAEQRLRRLRDRMHQPRPDGPPHPDRRPRRHEGPRQGPSQQGS